jgi:hypothetical protein
MALSVEVKERQQHLLKVLLTIKRDNREVVVQGLQDRIDDAISVMSAEDILWVEEIVGVKAR